MRPFKDWGHCAGDAETRDAVKKIYREKRRSGAYNNVKRIFEDLNFVFLDMKTVMC